MGGKWRIIPVGDGEVAVLLLELLEFEDRGGGHINVVW